MVDLGQNGEKEFGNEGFLLAPYRRIPKQILLLGKAKVRCRVGQEGRWDISCLPGSAALIFWRFLLPWRFIWGTEISSLCDPSVGQE